MIHFLLSSAHMLSEKDHAACHNCNVIHQPFTLSKEATETLDDFRQFGNFSAHKIKYNAKIKDIDNIRLKYRLAIEELLYVAQIKK